MVLASAATLGRLLLKYFLFDGIKRGSLDLSAGGNTIVFAILIVLHSAHS
jgi:hypothetical protein